LAVPSHSASVSASLWERQKRRRYRSIALAVSAENATIRCLPPLWTDEGVLGGQDYLNQPLNRCARLMAAGHGGQVLGPAQPNR
jgi:hypothetical protein